MSRLGRGRWWDTRTGIGSGLYRPITVLHAHRDGSVVLRGHASWRTVAGVLIRIGKRRTWFTWRPFYSGAKR
jgi:hypothetical protein